MTPAATAMSRVFVHPPMRAWQHYLKHLEKSPRLTKAFTSVCAALLGDSLAQHISNIGSKHWDYDWARTARLATFNAGMGVLGHEYYRVLDGRVMPHAATSPRAVVSKIVIDQFLFAPICTAVFYFYKVATEGRPSQYTDEMKGKFAATMLAGYKLWIPAHAVNFALVPNRQRVLYANVVSIFGTYILSRAQAGDFSQPEGSERRRKTTEVLFDGVMLKDD